MSNIIDVITVTMYRGFMLLILLPDGQSLTSFLSVAIVREEGSNGDREMVASFYQVGEPDEGKCIYLTCHLIK